MSQTYWGGSAQPFVQWCTIFCLRRGDFEWWSCLSVCRSSFFKKRGFEISSIDFSNMSKLILLDSLLQEVTTREIQIATYLIQTGLYFLIYSTRCLKFEYSIPSGFKGHSSLNQYEAWNMPKYIPIFYAYSIFSPLYFHPQKQICTWNWLYISPIF